MLEGLRFAEEDEGWAVKVDKMNQIVDIRLESLYVPTDGDKFR